MMLLSKKLENCLSSLKEPDDTFIPLLERGDKGGF